MIIQLKQTEIVIAIKNFLSQQGIAIGDKEVEITFTAGRKDKGLEAEVNIEGFMFRAVPFNVPTMTEVAQVVATTEVVTQSKHKEAINNLFKEATKELKEIIQDIAEDNYVVEELKEIQPTVISTVMHTDAVEEDTIEQSVEEEPITEEVVETTVVDVVTPSQTKTISLFN